MEANGIQDGDRLVKKLITLQLVTLAFTNIIVCTVSDMQIALGVVFMALFIAYSALSLVQANARIHTYGAIAIGLYMVAVYVYRFSDSRPSSIVYSLLFLMFFVVMMNGIRRWYTRGDLATVMQGILVAYFVNVIIAQMLQVAGLENSVTRLVFQVNTDPRYDSVRYQGFSSEPSYAAFVVIVAYVAALRMGQLSRKKNVALLAMLLYLILSFQSVYGYILIAPTLLAAHWRDVAKFRRIALPVLAIGLIALVTLSPALADSGRLGRIVHGIVSGQLLNPQAILELDGSTFIRLGSFLQYIYDAELTDLGFLVGHGAMSHMYSLGWEFRQVLNVNEAFNELILRPGFSVGFLYDYGLFGTLLVVLLIRRTATRRLFSIESFLIVMMFFNANFNTLLFWYIVTVFAACKLLEGQLDNPRLFAISPKSPSVKEPLCE